MKGIVGVLVGILSMMLIMTACSGLNSGEVPQEEGEEAPNAVIEQIKESKGFTPEELRQKLEETTGIELKDTNNQAVGMLADREAILAFIEELFSYPMQQEYPQDESDQGEIIGPINFYFSNSDDLYGLVKKDFIYVEGYYFLLQRGNLDKIQSLFSGHTIKAPDGNDN